MFNKGSIIKGNNMNEINDLFFQIKKKIEQLIPNSAEKPIVLAFLTTAQLWVNKAVTYPDK